MNVETYLEVADLFRFRWDPAILDAVAESPCRFRSSARRVQTRLDDHLDDNALTRGLERLRRAGYVTTTPAYLGRRRVPVYEITDDGLALLCVYRAVIGAYQDIRMEPNPHGLSR